MSFSHRCKLRVWLCCLYSHGAGPSRWRRRVHQDEDAVSTKMKTPCPSRWWHCVHQDEDTMSIKMMTQCPSTWRYRAHQDEDTVSIKMKIPCPSRRRHSVHQYEDTVSTNIKTLCPSIWRYRAHQDDDTVSIKMKTPCPSIRRHRVHQYEDTVPIKMTSCPSRWRHHVHLRNCDWTHRATAIHISNSGCFVNIYTFQLAHEMQCKSTQVNPAEHGPRIAHPSLRVSRISTVIHNADARQLQAGFENTNGKVVVPKVQSFDHFHIHALCLTYSPSE
jgi:hypothetical protein